MPKEKLQESVSELKSQLDEHGEVAAVDEQALGELAARLEVMLNGSSEHWEEDLVEEFERQLIQYEEAHPVIARVISQIITTLNGMGL